MISEQHKRRSTLPPLKQAKENLNKLHFNILLGHYIILKTQRNKKNTRVDLFWFDNFTRNVNLWLRGGLLLFLIVKAIVVIIDRLMQSGDP